MKDQMELFEDGGLKDEGGMVDEESGNEVPVGGTRKGVRDDIPAMVSEGEFVFPEDVVRYIGLDKLMQLRQKAKVGLKRMEDMGQMGNSDEATVPDDMPMDSPDLVIVAGEAPKEMAEGGAVVDGVAQTAAPRRLTPEIQRPERKQVNFKQLMGKNAVEFKQYRNAQGASLLIPFVGGNPIYPIPSGYTLYDASTDTADPTSPQNQADAIATEVSTAINRATGNDRDDDGPAPVPQSAFQKAGGWDMDTSGKDGKALQMWIDEASKFTNGTSTVVTGVAAAFGLGLPVAAMTSLEKKRILKGIDAKIAQARKTDMAGQVAALEAIKKDLTEKTTGISSALGSLTSSVANLFGMSEQQTKTATETMNKITAIEDTIANQAPPVRPTPAPVSEPTVTQEGGFGTPLVDELIPKPKPTPAPISEPTVTQEGGFGTPLVDELMFTPSLPVPPVSSYDEVKADPRLLESAGVPFQYPAPTPVTTPAPQPTTPVGASSFGEALTQQAPSLIAEDIQQTDAYKLRYGDTDAQMQSLMPPVVLPSAPVVTGYDDAPIKSLTDTRQEKEKAEIAAAAKAAKEKAEKEEAAREAAIAAAAKAAADKAAAEKAAEEKAERERVAAAAKAAREKAESDAREAAAAKAAKEKAEKEEAAREAAIAAAAKRDRDDDTNSIFNKTLETTGTATRTGSAAPSTSIRPTARPTTSSSDDSSSDDSSSDSSCVIATHGVATGGFSLLDKAKAELWCERTYHNKWYGEAFRRGYRYAGNTAIKKGNAAKHYQEFKDFVLYGRGLKKDWKSAVNYYKRTIQFFVTGLIVR